VKSIINGGKQIFKKSIINSVEVKSPTSGSKITSRAICCINYGSFNFYGKGSQNFNGTVISSVELEVGYFHFLLFLLVLDGIGSNIVVGVVECKQWKRLSEKGLQIVVSE